MTKFLVSSLGGHGHSISTDVHTSFYFFHSASLRRSLSFLWSGKPLQLTLQACDVKGKEEKSGPENLLVEPWTRDGEWWISPSLENEKVCSVLTRQCEIAHRSLKFSGYAVITSGGQ